MAITDNTAKWQVKKLTNFTDKEREIATQAQAEESVDNTKVMTPLRVKNAIDKQRPLKTFTLLEQLGLTTECTYADIYNALQNGWVFCFGVNKDTLINLELPRTGILLGYRQSGRLTLVLTDETNYGYYIKTYSSWGETGWRTILTDLYIATQAEAEAGTANTKVMTPLRTKQVVRKFYNVESLGLNSSTVTFADLRNAMTQIGRDGVELFMYVDKELYPNLSFPNDLSGSFYAKNAENTVMCEFVAPGASGDNKIYRCKIISSGVTAWKQLATNGALSMPTSSYMSVNVGDINIASDTQVKINEFYTAPADGWVRIVGFSGNSRVSEIIATIAGNKYGTKVWSEANTEGTLLLPIRKGASVTVDYTNLTTLSCYFFYAQSEV